MVFGLRMNLEPAMRTTPPSPRTTTALASTLLCAATLIASTGCDHPVAKALHPANVAHELRPHRLWRANRNRSPSENVYFSVPASEPTSVPAVPAKDQSRSQPEINSAAPAANNSSATASPSLSAAP